MFEHRVTIPSTAVPQSTLNHSQLTGSAVSVRKGSSAQPQAPSYWCEVVVFVVMDASVCVSVCAAFPHNNWTRVNKPLYSASAYNRCERDGLALIFVPQALSSSTLHSLPAGGKQQTTCGGCFPPPHRQSVSACSVISLNSKA